MPNADPALDLDEALRVALANHQQGQLPAAEQLYLRVLAQQPEHPHALHLLGLIAHQRADHGRALELIQRAIGVCPSNPDFHCNFGLICVNAGRTQEAIASFRTAIQLDPGNGAAHNNLSLALQHAGSWDEALDCSRRALQLDDCAAFRSGFVHCLRKGGFSRHDPANRPEILRALRECWCSPTDLAAACMDFIKAEPELAACLERAAQAWPTSLSGEQLYGAAGLAAVAGEELLRQLLVSTMASSLELEWFLTRARSLLLEVACGPQPPGQHWEQALAFHCALARQCFLNEYAFSRPAEEERRALALRQQLEQRLAAGGAVPELWPVAVAAYFPLSGLAGAEALLARAWPEPIQALLLQQIREPLEERGYRAGMARLTGVEDAISRRVQAQYEENPYPRWEKATGGEHALPLGLFLQRTFPHAPIRPLETEGPVQVLIAGCGTGQHPIKTAEQIAGTEILAVDLSLSSLCYAQRKTRAAGLGQIRYAQADLLELGAMEWRFDLIESVGVLHHLADPVAGWKVLLSLLRPGGFMKVGLYSQRAREDIHAVRRFIQERGYPATAEGIRACRQELMTQDNVIRFRHLVTSLDFFGISPCRDLLFHVQEHCFTLPGLGQCLRELELDFLGFELLPGVMDSYLVRFPGDTTQTDLHCWDRFEQENPLTFRGMYQFWMQKAPGK